MVWKVHVVINVNVKPTPCDGNCDIATTESDEKAGNAELDCSVKYVKTLNVHKVTAKCVNEIGIFNSLMESGQEM